VAGGRGALGIVSITLLRKYFYYLLYIETILRLFDVCTLLAK